jgi:PadR family transcriptional regulator, regulatory protein PadR
MSPPGSPGTRPLSPLDEHAEGALPRSYLRPCLLLVLAEGPSHGYELLEQVRRLGVRGAEPSALYRSLRAMEREALVSSSWELSRAGPPRRTYLLSDRGRRALRSSVGSLRDVQRLLASMLDRYDELAGRAAASKP